MFIYLYDYFTCMGVYVPCVPAENWRDRQLWATMCMLEIKLRSAAEAMHTLPHGAIS